jgi:hypothetical protein
MENSENYLETDKLILEYVKDVFNEGLDYIKRHNSKSNQIIIVLGILLGFLIGSSNSIMDVLLKESCNSFIILVTIFLLSIVLVFVSLFFALRSLDLGRFRHPGDPEEIYVKLRKEKVPRFIELFIGFYIKASEDNQKTIERRARHLRWSMRFLKFGSISLFIFILFFIVSKICFHFQ